MGRPRKGPPFSRAFDRVDANHTHVNGLGWKRASQATMKKTRRFLFLNDGSVAVVDWDDWDKCQAFRWYAVSYGKGVTYCKKGRKRWQAQIQVDGKSIYLGTFDTPELAATAYDQAATVHHGAFARLNFPLFFGLRACFFVN